MAPNPSTDGSVSPRAVYENAVDGDLAMRREAMVWREDSGEKFRVPLLPTKLTGARLKYDIPIKGKLCFTLLFDRSIFKSFVQLPVLSCNRLNHYFSFLFQK